MTIEIAPVKHTHIAGVAVKAALFANQIGREDLEFAVGELESLERDVAAELFTSYQGRRAKYAPRSANIWLRTAVKEIKRAQELFPVPVSKINSQTRREEVAREQAGQVTAIVSNLTSGFTAPMNAAELLAAAMEPARQWGFSPLLPDSSKEITDQFVDMAVSAVARLQDADWWLRKITTAFDRYRELIKIMAGFVRRGVSPYVSNAAAMEFRAKKTAQAKWLAGMSVINEEHGLELSLAEAHAASVSNPEVRRVELMVRMRGFEELAEQQGYVGEFYTWTAPSKYHAWITRKGSKSGTVSNKKYNGNNPRQTQAYLCGQWAKARAKLARDGVDVFGFRVVEPHHDATPHWHMLLFVKPEQRDQLRETLHRYACEHDAHELKNGTRARFDYQAIDSTKGSATGYIAKYISKNINGFQVGDDWEAEAQAGSTAINVAAWSSLWGIRQFQQIGGPSVTVWRELRRLREAVKDPVIESTRAAADAGNWAEYIGAMGGVALPRAERPVKLAHLIKPCASKYGDDVKKLQGVFRDGVAPIKTRLDGWTVSRTRKGGGLVCSGERSELSLSGGSRSPWSSDSNCTGSISVPKIAHDLARVGLDAIDRQRMERGAVVTMDGLFFWIRGGVLNQSKTRPQFHHQKKEHVPACPEADQWQREAEADRLRRAQAVLTGELDFGDFIADAPDPEPVLAALEFVLDKERAQAPASFRSDNRLKMMAGFVGEHLPALRKAAWLEANR